MAWSNARRAMAEIAKYCHVANFLKWHQMNGDIFFI